MGQESGDGEQLLLDVGVQLRVLVGSGAGDASGEDGVAGGSPWPPRRGVGRSWGAEGSAAVATWARMARASMAAVASRVFRAAASDHVAAVACRWCVVVTDGPSAEQVGESRDW
ncbi:hypothetical protein NKG94_34585 [Micromonospora sp. M12]